jgi:Carboxypeptidase regulatory-like domain
MKTLINSKGGVMPQYPNQRRNLDSSSPMMTTITALNWVNRIAFAVILSLGLFGQAVWAQQQTAEVIGTISDSSGAVVVGATVSVTNPSRAIKMVVTSDAKGRYVAPLLPPAADYQILVSKPGFNQVVRAGITLQVAQVALVNITLTVGSVSQSVSVTGAPPLLDTQTSSIGQVISDRTIVNLPLNGRSSFRLIQLTPGVTFSQAAYGQFGDVPVNSTWDTQFAINGGRSGGNAILIDGVPATTGFQNEITTIPSIDDTQEFKVQSNNLSAEYGRYAGGVVNVTTKAGTQQFHGSAFEFLRNSVLNADDYIDKEHGVAVPSFKMNQFGFAVGGPIVLPKIYDGHGKTFFFGDFQETRRNQGTTFVGTVPTALQRTGDFSQTLNSSGKLVTIYNPFSTRPNPSNSAQYIRDPFPGNVIPQNLLDPVAQKIIAYYPMPNTTGSANTNANNYISNAPLILDQNAGSVRIDQNVNQMYHFFGRFGWSLTSLDQPSTFGNVASGGNGQVGPTLFHNWTFALDNTLAISPTLLVTIDYGYARWYQSKRTLSYGFDNSSLGFPSSLVSQIAIPTFPAINVAGYSNMSGQTYLLDGNDAHNLLTSLTKIEGRHTIVVGTDVRLHLINRFSVINPGGTYAFANAQTQGPNPNTASATAGNAFASLLLGAGNSGSMPIGAGVELKDWYLAGYVQDDIRFSNKLTANIGLRYETESPYTDRHNGLNYFDPTVASPAANKQFPSLAGGLVFAGVNGQSDNVYRWNKNQFGPRIGFSYTPVSNTVARGGFGIVFAPLEITDTAAGIWPNTGFSSSTGWTTSVNGGLTPANLLNNPFPNGLVTPTGSSIGAGTALGQSISVWDANPKTPQSYQWTFGIQRQLPSDILIDVAYVANRGLHLTSDFNLSQLSPSYLSLGSALQSQVANPFQPFVSIGPLSKSTVAQMQLLLPFPQFTGVKEMNATWGDSNYQAMQLKFEKRETHGVSFLAAYTISKWLSDVANEQDNIGPNDSPVAQNYYDLRAEKSLSENDIPQSLIVNSVVQLPFGPGRAVLGSAHGVLARLVGGWSASGILTIQRGLPLVFSAPIVIGGNRPNYVQGVSPKLQSSRSTADKVAEWFDTKAFALPPAFTFGNVPRTVGTVRGPAVHNLDFALSKNTQLVERLDMEFQAQAFNLTNTPHFGFPVTNMSSPSFGQITTTLASPPAREIQFAVKFKF